MRPSASAYRLRKSLRGCGLYLGRYRIYTAAKTLAFTDAEATYNTIALAAEKAQGMRDTIAEMNYWIRDQKITAEYNKLVATAESAEKRARDEADAAHKEAQSQIKRRL